MAAHPAVAKFAVPDDVVFVEEIPHNSTGKVSKLALRAMFASGTGGGNPQSKL